MHSSPSRLIAIACIASALLAAGGLAFEAWRFGLSAGATSARLERDVRDRFAVRGRDVQSLGQRVAATTGATVARAIEQRDDLPAVFDQLTSLATSDRGGMQATTATVYIRQPEGQFKILAWSDGPAEGVDPSRLAGEASLFVAPGTLGLRLVSVQPIVSAGHRIAVAAAEAVLAPAMGIGQPSETYLLDTSFGAVTIKYDPGGLDSGRRPGEFAVTPPGGGGFDVQVSPDVLHGARMIFRTRAMAIAALPLIMAAVLLTAPILRRRTRARALVAFLAWSAAAALLVAGAGVSLIWLARLVGAPSSTAAAMAAVAALGLVALVPMSWWWRRPHRLSLTEAPGQFLVEQLASGLLVALCVWLTTRFVQWRIRPDALDQWQLPMFRLPADGLLAMTALFLGELALFWSAAMALAVMAGRWRLSARQPARVAAGGALWLLPPLVLLFWRRPLIPAPVLPSLLFLAAAAIFAVGANALRRRYRRATQAMRLVLLFLGLLLPLVALYPLAWSYADRTARDIVTRDYAPATARRPNDTLRVLTKVRLEIDAIPSSRLTQLVAPIAIEGTSVPTILAFNVWSQTSLASTRLTSAVELFDERGTLVSRFALNMPEYQGADTTLKSMPATCTWEPAVGEAVPFGGEERDMLHVRRQICDLEGRPHGAVVVHVVNDYQALPFVSTPNPYRAVLRSADPAARGSVLNDLQVVVYGWSLTPLFTSGNVAWPITPDLFRGLYRSREAFWTRVDAEGRQFEVYFSNDNRFIYALGYPSTTGLQHLTRLAEAATLMAGLFVLALFGAAVYAPFARPTAAPLRRLLDEIRTSFYRKLFLWFVLAAIGPTLLFAIAFGIYMTAKFRADVENEASTVVTVARRVLEQTSSTGSRTETPSDDVMVWVGQVVHQDVNLFEGPELLATSQRDLYASGLLPTRTPAKVYRAIALNRLPSFVAEEYLGTFAYVVAAAPMPTAGHDFVLSVPLASRQREIERELDELNRGVLVGAVFIILFAAGLGASVASRVSDPVARLSRATKQIRGGRLDVRLVATTRDELSRLIRDFNEMAATLEANRTELARTHQIKAWAEMARQVAHEIKNPLTPIQLAAEHLDHVHADQGRPLGPVFDQCVTTILRQVRLLRQIASEFSTFAGQPTPRFSAVPIAQLLEEVTRPYRAGLTRHTTIDVEVPSTLPDAWIDRTLIARALTNLVENALQAMPTGGVLRATAAAESSRVVLTFTDSGVGMDAEAAARAFEPYFSTKTAGSGLGLANARRNIETCGGTVRLTSAPGQGTSVVVTLPTRELST